MIEGSILPAWQGRAGSACGMDEVGRGALAGPLVAAAVILPHGFSHPLLRDSKLLSESQREEVEPFIRHAALALRVEAVPVPVIDRRGVGWANRIAFERLIRQVTAEAYLADGNLRLRTGRSYRSVVGGDRLVPAISAASIVAKVHRDRLMRKLHPRFPHYGWDENKGYGTPHHLLALQRHGPCRHHRLSFLHPSAPELFADALASV
ncbi:MAG: ribonuclease HII [Candidatus Dormibacteria bacterium]